MANDLPRKLGLFDSLAIVVGLVIGGGIFLVPNLVAREIPSASGILAVWAFAGVVSFFGSLACAELGSAYPDTGGQYVFIREAYGPLAGFVCGWSAFTVTRAAQISWLAVTFPLYLSYFIPLSVTESKIAALASIVVFTYINYRGVTAGALVQNCFTSAKVAGLLIIICSAFFVGQAGRPVEAVVEAAAGQAGKPILQAFFTALIACLLAYDGWVGLSFVAGEIRDPKRNVLRALALGSVICIAIYLLANLAYLRVLTVPEIAASDRVGAAVTERVLGPAGGKLVSAIILVSIIGAINGCILTSPRVYFAQAADGLFFRRFADVHPRYRTPGFALIMQGIWCAVLVITGSYNSLIDYAMFGIWLFYVLMVAAVIVLRRRRPDLQRPYRMWGYPATPLLFVAIAVGFLANMLLARPVPSLISLGLMATGIPVYWIWARRPEGQDGIQRRVVNPPPRAD